LFASIKVNGWFAVHDKQTDDGVPAIKCWLALQTLSVASNFAKCTPIEICRQIFVTGDDHSALGQIFVIAMRHGAMENKEIEESRKCEFSGWPIPS
jgi:hypothetical protein